MDSFPWRVGMAVDQRHAGELYTQERLMQDTNGADSLGARIVSAARMAVELHLAMSDPHPTSSPMAMIGGTDRHVTDDKCGNDER